MTIFIAILFGLNLMTTSLLAGAIWKDVNDGVNFALVIAVFLNLLGLFAVCNLLTLPHPL